MSPAALLILIFGTIFGVILLSFLFAWLSLPFFIKRSLTTIEAQLLEQNRHLANIEQSQYLQGEPPRIPASNLPPENLYGLAPTPIAPPPPVPSSPLPVFPSS